MDKMIKDAKGNVTITNDGPTILSDSFTTAAKEAMKHLDKIAHPIDIKNKEA